MDDVTAERVATAVMHLAVVMRDEGIEEIAAAARALLDAADGDPLAALTVAAALVNIDAPIDCWWQAGLDGLRPVENLPVQQELDRRNVTHRRGPKLPAPCGTRGAFERHKRRGAPIDDACQQAYDDWLAELREARANYRRTA